MSKRNTLWYLRPNFIFLIKTGIVEEVARKIAEAGGMAEDGGIGGGIGRIAAVAEREIRLQQEKRKRLEAELSGHLQYLRRIGELNGVFTDPVSQRYLYNLTVANWIGIQNTIARAGQHGMDDNAILRIINRDSGFALTPNDLQVLREHYRRHIEPRFRNMGDFLNAVRNANMSLGQLPSPWQQGAADPQRFFRGVFDARGRVISAHHDLMRAAANAVRPPFRQMPLNVPLPVMPSNLRRLGFGGPINNQQGGPINPQGRP